MDIVLTIVLLISLTGCVKPASVDSRTTDFYDRATDMLDSFDNKFNTDSNDCASDGKDKGKQFSNFDNNYQAAVSLVNIYTQECYLSNMKAFYSVLNFEISHTNSQPYSTFATLLDEAIDILSEKNGVKGKTVYRGQCDSFPSSGMYIPKRFTSTSTSVLTALTFPGDEKNCFVVVENANGVNIVSFSAMPKEGEVLISYRATFEVKEKITDAQGVQERITKLNPLAAVIYPSYLKKKNTFVVLGAASDYSQTGDASFRKPHLAVYFLVSMLTIY